MHSQQQITRKIEEERLYSLTDHLVLMFQQISAKGSSTYWANIFPKHSFINCSIIYSCKVSTPDLKQYHALYNDITEQTFKDRLYKHNNYSPTSKKCIICLTEKCHIIFSTKKLVNQRNELVTKCRYENNFNLANYKHIPPYLLV